MLALFRAGFSQHAAPVVADDQSSLLCIPDQDEPVFNSPHHSHTRMKPSIPVKIPGRHIKYRCTHLSVKDHVTLVIHILANGNPGPNALPIVEARLFTCLEPVQDLALEQVNLPVIQDLVAIGGKYPGLAFHMAFIYSCKSHYDRYTQMP